jgi:PhzF family phenazine biosynthesis protein
MKLFLVDAFADKMFSGNPAAVCMLAQAKSEDLMQNIAHEMNLSETAFIHPYKDGYFLRWFTPTTEVDLCGHATLATAHILWEMNHLTTNEKPKFYTKSGVLTARQRDQWIELDFPAEPASATDAPEGLIQALGVSPTFIGRNRMDYIVEVESEEMLRKARPNFDALSRISTRGVILTSRSDSDKYDFVSRFFAPASGVNEDPVTGSAHCCLGPYWQKKLNKDSFTAYQASRRGGVVKVRVSGDRVLLMGQAIIVLRGELMV